MIHKPEDPVLASNTDPKASAMADILAATRVPASPTPAGMPPAGRKLRKEKSKSRMGAEDHDPAITHLAREKSQDYHEAAHDGCITEPPKLLTVASFDVGGLVGVGAKSGGGGKSSGSGIGDSLSRLAQEGMAKLAPISGAPAVADEDQALEVEMYIRCEDILATRGTRTDSFVRVILIEDDTLAEHEVGRTEVQDDTLDPEYRHPVQLKFRLDDEKHRLRIELCDPGETKDKVSPSSTSNAAPDPNPNPDASHCPLTLTLALTPSPHFPLLQTRVRSDSPTLTLTLTLT